MKKVEALYIVDDDNVYQFLAKRTIENTGLTGTITPFSNGQEAIHSLKAAIKNNDILPDMILLDLTMPVLDGWGFLEDFSLIKEQLKKKIRLFVVSSSINPADIERAKQIEDVTDYVVKPITAEKFREMLGTI